MNISVGHYETRDVKPYRDLGFGDRVTLKPVLGGGTQGLILKSHRGEIKIPLSKEQFDQYVSLYEPVVSGYEQF